MRKYQANADLMSIGHSRSFASHMTWLIEGFVCITFVALLWSNEEPSKWNTLFASWSAYSLVAFVLYLAVNSGTVTKPLRWIRIYSVQCLLLLLVCDFVWCRMSVIRADGFYFDNVRFDYCAALLAKANLSLDAVIGQNYAGTIWYAGLIYWIFGISKFYVVIFNGSLSFITWILFASTMKQIEGNANRWQWLRFGMLLPDMIINFSSVSKEPLCTFIVALGIWLVAKALMQRKAFFKLTVALIPVFTIGLMVRAATVAIVYLAASIWFWNIRGSKGKLLTLVLLCIFAIGCRYMTNPIMRLIGSAEKDWSKTASNLTNPELRHAPKIDYSVPSSWNTIMESAPFYLLPIVSPIKGAFMMLSPMPIWKIPVGEMLDSLTYRTEHSWSHWYSFFQKLSTWLFVLSTPWLLANVFGVYRTNHRLWITTGFTFIVLVGIMGFLVRGIIVPRYRPMLLPFWLCTCGIGHYYNVPKRYVLHSLAIFAIGAIIYIIPKL